MYNSTSQEPTPMKNFAGGGATEEGGQVILRAIDPKTGKRAWEYPMTGFGRMWSGTVSTAGGVVFTGDDDGHLVALEAKTGRHLWHFNMGELLTASPITYEVDGKQYVAIASATAIFSFGLDARWGRMFVRVCPYFPFSARVCLNQHYWLALRLQERGIRFRQCANAFLQCSDPKALQKLADSLTADDLITCAQKWLASFTPFFTAEEREHAGVQHRLFFAQVEFCDNLIFRRRAAVDALEQRLLDANRSIGQPNKLTLIFGRRITRRHAGKLQTVIEDLNLPNPVIRSHYRKGFLKQYVRDRFLLRTESATNNISTDYGIGKAVENLPELRMRLHGIIDRYLEVQQDILETFVDREELRRLTQPTLLPNGRRIPGLKLDQPRQLALMHSLVRFCYLAAEGTFTTRDLYPQTLQALQVTPEEYKLGSLRYDLWKLRAKGLVEKIPHSRRYRLLPHGYQICLVFLKLYEKIYAPLTAGILQPFAADQSIPKEKITALDRR